MALIRGSQISGSVASASYALTASFALNAGGGGSNYFIASGSVTASVDVTGDIFIIRSGSYNPLTVSSTGLTTISGSAANLFIIKNASNQAILTVSQSGIVQFATQSTDPIGTPNPGAIWFTSASFFVGLE